MLKSAMTVKRNATDYINDILSANLPFDFKGVDLQSAPKLLEIISEYYDFTEEEFRLELRRSKGRIEEAIGVPLTDEQLEALSGGKTKLTSSDDIAIGGGSAFGVAILAAIGATLEFLIK